MEAAVPAITAYEALNLLRDGNARFAAGALEHPRADTARRSETLAAQHPFAAVLACADSRCPPEIIFDQGIGDLFVVRVAGNVVCPETLASLEYAVDHLGVRLIVVLGHSHCGAVAAALAAALARSASVGATDRSPAASQDEPLDQAVRENIWQAVAGVLSGSALIAKCVREVEVEVHGAHYDLATGAVEWLGRHRDETSLTTPR